MSKHLINSYKANELLGQAIDDINQIAQYMNTRNAAAAYDNSDELFVGIQERFLDSGPKR